MSIFSAIGDFFASLFSSIDKEYQKLDPVVKADLNTGIQVANVIKANLDKPASDVLVLIETEIGSFATDKVKAVLNQVTNDLGIVATVADQSDQLSALTAIMSHLAPKTGPSWEDAVFAVAKYVAINLTGGSLIGSVANIVVQWVYNRFFAQAKNIAPVDLPQPAAA